MNLYEIVVQHFSQKDSHTSTEAYLAAENDEQVYECVNSKPKEGLYGWSEEDGEIFDVYDDDYKVIGTETFKEKIIRLKGQINDDDVVFSDLYYGLTLYGWREIGPITSAEVHTLQKFGIVYEVKAP